MAKLTTKIPPMLFVVAAILLWSTGGLFIKMTTLDAFAVNAARSFLAALTVAFFTFRKGLRLTPFILLKSLIYAGILSSFVYATKTTTAANAIFLQYTAPIYVLALSPFVLKEKFRGTDLIIVVCCLAGMGLFFLETPGATTQLAASRFTGNLVALVSGVLFGLYFVLLRHPKSLGNRNPAISVFYGNLLVVVFMLPFLFHHPPQPTKGDLLAVLFLGVFQIGISYTLFTYGVARGVRPFDASIIGFLEPLLNPVWVFLVVGETPSLWAIIGGLVIIATVAAHTIWNNRNRLSTAKQTTPG
ncbi:MAG: DMT family transporter [Acidobacteriota bacterium]